MLDFDLEIDESAFKLKCFTNVGWIKDKFKYRKLIFTDECEKSDICIVDSNFKFKEKTRNMLKISIDELSDDVDTLIGRDYIEAFLDMIEKYGSEDYGVGMVDFNDIKMVTQGKLIEYLKLTLNSDDETECIEEFRKSLICRELFGGLIFFATKKNLKTLSDYCEILNELYSNMDKVIMTPITTTAHLENYIELFVFDGQRY